MDGAPLTDDGVAAFLARLQADPTPDYVWYILCVLERALPGPPAAAFRGIRKRLEKEVEVERPADRWEVPPGSPAAQKKP